MTSVNFDVSWETLAFEMNLGFDVMLYTMRPLTVSLPSFEEKKCRVLV